MTDEEPAGSREEEWGKLVSTPGFCKPIELSDDQQLCHRIGGLLKLSIHVRPENCVQYTAEQLQTARLAQLEWNKEHPPK